MSQWFGAWFGDSADPGGGCDYPAVGDVRDGILFGSGAYTGTLELPDEADVLEGVQYGEDGTEFTGTLVVTGGGGGGSGGGGGGGGGSGTGEGVRRASILEILGQIRDEIVRLEILPADRVHFVARDSRYIPKFQGDNDVLLRPGRYISIEPWTTGAGRAACAIRRYLDVIPRTRLALDKIDHDEIWLLHATRGQFVFEESLIDALQLFLPVEDDVAMLIEPMRLVDGSKPDKTDKLWGESVATFEMLYMLAIDVTR